MRPSGDSAQLELRIGSFYGLASALLFGASTPLSKLLLPGVAPIMLAALLYLGAAAVLTAFRLGLFIRGHHPVEAALRRSDVPILCAMVGFGGVMGPILMLFGLARVSALTGALLLNLEAVFTIIIAIFVFREHLDLNGTAAAALVVLGAVLIGYSPGTARGHLVGVVMIGGACLSWAIDNNLSQRLSLREPAAVVQVKTTGAGATSLILAVAAGHGVPAPKFLVGALALGSFSYGASLICVMFALRRLGAARQAAWFSAAPFFGAASSVLIFGLVPTASEVLGMLSMIAGVCLLMRERHDHIHAHEPLEHDHVHVHDEHHQHRHAGVVTEPHSHAHRHDSIIHEHPHVSDLHHRHRHA
jgi:drug/metabolite transporter (DMT)-like permease